MEEQKNEPSMIKPSRSRALADGVFAFAMTVLVIKLAVPGAAGITNTELNRVLLDMWPDFLLYGLSFVILGVFWIMHRTAFDCIKAYNSVIAWMNIIFLMFITLIPFSTALFGVHGALPTTALVYGINLLASTCMLWFLFIYVSRNKSVLVDDLSPNVIRGGRIMGLIYASITLVGIAISFVSPIASFVIYGLWALAFIILTMLNKAETAMAWRAGGPRKED